MIEKLRQYENEYQEVLASLSDPTILGDQKKVAELGKRERSLKVYSQAFLEYQSLEEEIEEFTFLKNEETNVRDKKELEVELEELIQKREKLLARIKELLVPEDPDDQKDVIVEIRAAAGGDEAALFAADLFRMYFNYAVSKQLKVDVMSSHEIGIGGFKEIIFEVAGTNARKYFKFESGVHRVQRVPTTESGGRIHTSTITVAVMTEAEEADIEIDPSDIRIDVFNASGHGGQNVQKNETAIRITHLPTNTVVVCQDERSKLQNKLRALKILHTRLLDVEKQRIQDEESQTRKSQVGWGDRSEKIRTYNYPQNRVTDHRIGYSSHNLTQIMNGDLDEFVEALQLAWNKNQTSTT
ncbi:MAG: peptide chain release factor 1 [Caldisericia bacterium]|nr:peptide chain release factor 1 [Caldisericia bacterium]MDD4614556.1 peptide chain release factor 1 [Caldisericia bacterium]